MELLAQYLRRQAADLWFRLDVEATDDPILVATDAIEFICELADEIDAAAAKAGAR